MTCRESQCGAWQRIEKSAGTFHLFNAGHSGEPTNDKLARSSVAGSAGVAVSVLPGYREADFGEINKGGGCCSLAIVYLQILLTSMAARDRG